jgi:hypothetical protein
MNKMHIFMVVLLFAGVCHGSPVRDLQHELGIDDSNWKVATENDSEITWLTKTGEAVTLAILQGKSELTNPDDQKGMQHVFRDEAKHMHGGLVEVEFFESGGVKCGLVTMKFQAGELGGRKDAVAYQINAIIPTVNGSYTLQVAAVETGTTGRREAMVAVIDAAKSNADPKAMEKSSMRRDPYDDKYDADALYTMSDDRKWDDVVADHPLTRIRKLMDLLIKQLKISDRIKKEAAFKQ